MLIVPLEPQDTERVHQTARLLFNEFRSNWPDAWPNLNTALEEVQSSFNNDRISRVALLDSGLVIRWVGGISHYNGNVWELHPLVVSSAYQGKGVGRALVQGLEATVAERGALTLWVATDDENNLTSLGGVDLYPDPLHPLSALKNLRRHPFEFYQKLGFAVVGVLPDANGLGKPDIYMAKRVAANKAGYQETA